MEFQDLKRKSEKELHKLLFEKRNELRELRFKAGEGQLKNMHTIRQTRRLVAQILSLLNNEKGEQVKESAENKVK